MKLNVIVEGNLVVNKGELLYYGYPKAVLGVALLGYMHVPNLVALRVRSVLGSLGTVYAGINTPLPPDIDGTTRNRNLQGRPEGV